LNRINILDTSTSNKIAAGEVVERPFSVVKELVENSVDSNASNITVEIFEGGEKLIKVTDNGEGIYPEDMEKAFFPHATSKINNIYDIFKIDTMGFRGEALASIASVSKVSMKSRTMEFDFGRDISINAGKIEYIKDAGTNVGTIVEVSDIFFNVPARKKFLKSVNREFAYISDILTRIAIANPEISFKLINNNKVTFSTYGTGDVTDVIRSIYGKSACENVIKFEEHTDIASVYGFIGNAEIAKGNRNHQSIFVNRRYIKNKVIAAAVENAFKSFITINKYPFYILFINIYPEFIDVNVHPTKSEIKFNDEREIYKLVFNSVHSALRKSLNNSFNIEIENDIKSDNKATLISESGFKFDNKTEREKVQLPIDFKQENLLMENFNTKYANESTEPIPKIPDLRIIGQFNKTYIIGENKEELYLIDQHAAHEKILFEKYINSIKNNEVAAQVLITPAVLELNNEDYILYEENSSLFKTLGFNIEGFGQNTICIREVPLILGKPDIKEFFIKVIENIRDMGSGDTIDIKYNSIARTACRAAVKANDVLSDMEMKALINELKFIEDPFTCPHGRPTIIKIGLNELEKRFKRIQ